MATQAIQDRRRWLNHRHYRTYEIALGITRAVRWPADLRDLEFLAEGITGFLPPWQKETAVHRLARVVASDLFLRDTEGPYIQVFEETDGVPARMNRYLPVDVAMHAYGIDHGEMFRVPEPDETEVRKGNTVTWAESERVANACYDYTLDLQWTEPYDLLLTHLSDEVFHTIFPNRVLLDACTRCWRSTSASRVPNSSQESPMSRGYSAGKVASSELRHPCGRERRCFFATKGTALPAE
jgi:hypothetical protein